MQSDPEIIQKDDRCPNCIRCGPHICAPEDDVWTYLVEAVALLRHDRSDVTLPKRIGDFLERYDEVNK